MQVYLLYTRDDYDYYGNVEGIYSSYEKAEAQGQLLESESYLNLSFRIVEEEVK